MRFRILDRSDGVALRKRSNSPCGSVTDEQKASKSSPTMPAMRSLTARSPEVSGVPSPRRLRITWDGPSRLRTRSTSQVAPSTSKTSRTRAVLTPEVMSFFVSLPICGVFP